MTSVDVALVTGANRGPGKEVARGLARLGYTVLLGARDPMRGLAAANELREDPDVTGELRAVHLDVTDELSIEVLAAETLTRYGKLDVLVNVGAGPGAVKLSADAMRSVYENDVFGVVAVIDAFLPLLTKAPAARIVNVTGPSGDVGARVGATPALEALTAYYAATLTAVNIRVGTAQNATTAIRLAHGSRPRAT